MRLPVAGALLLLAACAGTTPRAPSVSFVGDAGGIAVPEVGQRIDFGRAPAGVIAAFEREYGRKGEEMSLAGCPSGVTRQGIWGDFVLTFTDERFVGWRTGDLAAGQTCKS